MIDTDDLDNMSRRDLVELTVYLLEAYNESLAEVKRLRGLLQEVADDYTDAGGITYEIHCEFSEEGEEDE